MTEILKRYYSYKLQVLNVKPDSIQYEPGSVLLTQDENNPIIIMNLLIIQKSCMLCLFPIDCEIIERAILHAKVVNSEPKFWQNSKLRVIDS